MCFQRAGGEGDLPLTYFLLLLEVLISMQNSTSRQKLSLGSGIISALHRSLHHRSHQFQPGCSRFSPVPASGRSDLVLPASTENSLRAQKIAARHAADFGQARGLPAASDEHRAHPEEHAAVSTPRPEQHTHRLTLWGFHFLFFIHKEVGSELGTVLTWKAKALKIQTRTPRTDLILWKTRACRPLKQALKHTGFHLEV